jgi:16S rRNA (cytidine1402-2'-O)-methyltransferase
MQNDNNILTSTLYVLATPIGNLGDISSRALQVLRDVDVIAAEDTRHTAPLLAHFGLPTKRLIAVHDHNEQQAALGLINLLAQGKSIALVSDAGTPAVSDPGAIVVRAVLAAGYTVVPIPGACAAVAALSASGMGENGFIFFGFLPAKSSGRISVLTPWLTSPFALILYESPHRIVESLADISSLFDGHRRIAICREITKKFETIVVLPAQEIAAYVAENLATLRGEFVIIIDSYTAIANDAPVENSELLRVLKVLLKALSVKQAAVLAAELAGCGKNEAYQMALKMKQEGEAEYDK